MTKKKLPIIKPFNPLDKEHLGESVADALLQQQPVDLPPESFVGAGIYAIYYTGEFDLYSDLAELNENSGLIWPIYIGKAVPAGARKGGFGLGSDPGSVLSSRLKEHATSIDAAANLKLSDFSCRFLVVDDIWIPLAESMLIEMFHPLWNRILDGFGNHDPGKGRYNQQKSAWDHLHSGRSWAEQLSDYEGSEDLEGRVSEYITTSKEAIINNYGKSNG